MTIVARRRVERPAPPTPQATQRGAADFRDDIQGLRAVAVLLVLAFHAGVPYVTGGFVGVDVFFVISGFLITGLMLREIERTGRLSLGRFWARRVRRLLPATAVVLAATGAMAVALLPFTRWPSIAGDLTASALYVVNWRFADESVNYLASEDAPSPVQHFWSLAVEEQFYVLWPLLILALLLICRRRGWALRRTLGVGVMAIAVPSLAWSIHLTTRDPGPAYFVSTTRLWELAIGAMLAIGIRKVTGMRRGVAHLVGCAGLVAIGWSALTFDADTPFPGVAALAPTLGAAAVIAAGASDVRNGAGVLLSWRPMRDIGALSYSLYLWHWPVLVAATALWGRDDRTLWLPVAVLAIGFSVVPAWFTYRVVEAPIHHSRTLARVPWRAVVVGVACTAVGLASAIGVRAAIPEPAAPSDANSAPGAAVLGNDPDADPDGVPADSVPFMTPDALAAADDIAGLGEDRCIQNVHDVVVKPCEAGPPSAETTVAVVGDSKMHQWLPALERIAEQHGWRLVTYLKDACPLVRVDLTFNDDVFRDCAAYNDARYEALLDDPSIDFVITSQRTPNARIAGDVSVEAARSAMIEDLRATWAELEEAGKNVIVLVDNPQPTLDVMECVAAHPDKLTDCAFDRAGGFESSGEAAQAPALEDAPGVARVDINDYICPDQTCPAVIGNVLVYRRGSHLTATYVESLVPQLDAALIDAMDS